MFPACPWARLLAPGFVIRSPRTAGPQPRDVLRLALPRRDGEGVGDVADGFHAAVVVDDDRDDFEAARDLPQALGLEVAVRQFAEPVLLAGIDRRLRRRRRRRIGLDRHVLARLDFHENEGLALLRDEVDFAGAGTHVLLEDGVPAPAQEA